jgi:hypothetical protein
MLIWRKLVLLVMMAMTAATSAAQVKDMEESTCKKAKDRVWVRTTETIPGDGAVHVKIVVNGPRKYDFVGGHALGMRQGVDDHFTFSCPMNPAQPPTQENFDKRKCMAPGTDIAVEQCSAKGSVLTCEYVGSKDSSAKVIELGGCFDD